ncbi:Major facilitator superfamily domain general substrate transporter [Penicillium samsonianum]|uniref:Major facilitator superfamily domain general substrate transporter n=1 Tax=Penicillium samsonianum TaxID=1882272 RepID=UPI00254859F0|nr:Major facilitator superfamily domain general substrate transporter [Penicillium samsonianum]KAJ6137597.1 Major facilitator superfamily domain general substrate transporter [Penicillium samsonianum]
MDPLKSRVSELEEAKPSPLDRHGDLAHQEKLTRRVLWKLDIHILPILALLFLMSFLDRTNVGNAKILGLEADLSITDHQYDIGLAVFYLTYICSELPSNLVLKKASPKIWLPFLTAIWGIITMCLGFVQNFAGFVAVRALLGIAEGGLLPGMVLYLSSFYRRGDLALRIGLFYTAASLSGAFGGLLARGLAEIGPRGGIEGWRWILIIEGLLTFVCGVFSFFFLPNSLESASFLTTEEKAFGGKRLMLDNPGSSEVSLTPEAESFKWSEVRRGVLDLQVWLSASAYFAILSGLYSFGLFLPTIIKNLGFAKDANEVQLWSVIPYAVAAVITVVVAIISDRLRLRGVVMLFTLPIAIIGYAAIANIHSPRVQYGMTFLMATGQYASVPCMLVWLSNNSAGHYKRATTSALQLAIANAGGFVSTFNYPSRDGPLFHRGHTIILGLLVFAWFMILLNVLYCAKINRDKRNGKYDQYAGYNDDRNPEFMMVL